MLRERVAGTSVLLAGGRHSDSIELHKTATIIPNSRRNIHF